MTDAERIAQLEAELAAMAILLNEGSEGWRKCLEARDRVVNLGMVQAREHRQMVRRIRELCREWACNGEVQVELVLAALIQPYPSSLR